jgi:hypothetical protein
MVTKIERDDFPDEKPTRREAPSGRWLVAVDRGQKLIESAIEKLENGGDVQDVLEDLRQALALVNGGGQ